MKIAVVATGGTIASTVDAAGVATATLSGADLVAQLPAALHEEHQISVVDMRVPGSWNTSAEVLQRLASDVADLASAGTPVVVTHGTDTLEDTAWLLESVVRPLAPQVPIVLTAAMRNASEFAGDGPRNLADAVLVASSSEAAGLGVVICVNGELHHARWATKTHATALTTFASPDRCAVGSVDSHRVVVDVTPPPAVGNGAQVESALTGLGNNVPIVVSQADADPALVPWLIERGARAIVVDGVGSGNVHRDLAGPLVDALAEGVPVVVATRCLAGMARPAYGGDGGFATLAAAGAVSSRGLNTSKARISTQLALSGTVAASSGSVAPGSVSDMDAVASYFESVAPA